MKQKLSTTHQFRQLMTKATLVMGALVIALAAPMSTYAVDYDAQIRELEAKVDAYQGEAAKLAKEAGNLESIIAKLDAQQAAMQTRIDLSEAKRAKLVREIAENQKRLDLQRKAFADTLRDSYVDGTPSTIEILASSKTVGDYIDKQQYRDSLNSQIQNTISTIKELKEKLSAQKKEVERVIADQKSQKATLAAKEAERAQILALTRGKQANYNRLVKQTQGEIAQKKAAQQAYFDRLGIGQGAQYGSSSYPWPNAPMNYNDYCVYPDGKIGADDWGYCLRQCVSYVAWKLATDGRGNSGFSGLGHANGWVGAGSAVGASDVKAGDVVVLYSPGGYGHVMYVDRVNGSNVVISQMNVPYDSGRYSTDVYTKSELASFSIRRFH